MKFERGISKAPRILLRLHCGVARIWILALVGIYERYLTFNVIRLTCAIGQNIYIYRNDKEYVHTHTRAHARHGVRAQIKTRRDARGAIGLARYRRDLRTTRLNGLLSGNISDSQYITYMTSKYKQQRQRRREREGGVRCYPTG